MESKQELNLTDQREGRKKRLRGRGNRLIGKTLDSQTGGKRVPEVQLQTEKEPAPKKLMGKFLNKHTSSVPRGKGYKLC